MAKLGYDWSTKDFPPRDEHAAHPLRRRPEFARSDCSPTCSSGSRNPATRSNPHDGDDIRRGADWQHVRQVPARPTRSNGASSQRSSLNCNSQCDPRRRSGSWKWESAKVRWQPASPTGSRRLRRGRLAGRGIPGAVVAAEHPRLLRRRCRVAVSRRFLRPRSGDRSARARPAACRRAGRARRCRNSRVVLSVPREPIWRRHEHGARGSTSVIGAIHWTRNTGTVRASFDSWAVCSTLPRMRSAHAMDARPRTRPRTRQRRARRSDARIGPSVDRVSDGATSDDVTAATHDAAPDAAADTQAMPRRRPRS